MRVQGLELIRGWILKHGDSYAVQQEICLYALYRTAPFFFFFFACTFICIVGPLQSAESFLIDLGFIKLSGLIYSLTCSSFPFSLKETLSQITFAIVSKNL